MSTNASRRTSGELVCCCLEATHKRTSCESVVCWAVQRAGAASSPLLRSGVSMGWHHTFSTAIRPRNTGRPALLPRHSPVQVRPNSYRKRLPPTIQLDYEVLPSFSQLPTGSGRMSFKCRSQLATPLLEHSHHGGTRTWFQSNDMPCKLKSQAAGSTWIYGHCCHSWQGDHACTETDKLCTCGGTHIMCVWSRAYCARAARVGLGVRVEILHAQI
eukprot:364899-Chlamydomonas_euryale.AAC.5